MSITPLVSKVCLIAAPPLAIFLSSVQPANAEESTFLWEIESPNNTVYLLGSIHLLRATDYPLPRSIQAAFDDAETVVFEIDIADSESPQTLETFVRAALPDSPEEVLPNALDDKTYRLAEETAAEMGIPFTGFQGFEPWAFYLSVTGFQALHLGFEPQYGVDAYFFNQANQANKTVLALETVEEQLGFFDTLPVSVQADLVEQTILELDTFETSIETMVDAWKSGDIIEFERVTLDGFVDFPEAYEALLVQRNQNWLPDIESFINQSEDYLVIVGAAHLVGEDSVIKLLQDKDYTVQQIGHN